MQSETMDKRLILNCLLITTLSLGTAAAWAAPAPSADLHYRVSARQKGFNLDGDGLVQWRNRDGKYTLAIQLSAGMFGKLHEQSSEGTVSEQGLAPATFYEKRFRKEPSTTRFDSATRQVVYSGDAAPTPLKGGEQDRASAQWQLVSMARSAPAKFIPGSEWKFTVAGRRDAETWTFRVVGQEPVKTGMGDVLAVHLVKAPPADSKEQSVDLWLAPSLEWYPVRLRFVDADGEFVDQRLDKITRK
jgi:hypothetical protein